MPFICVGACYMSNWGTLDEHERGRAHVSQEAWERLFGGERVLEGRQLIEVGGKTYVVGLPHIDDADTDEGEILYLPDFYHHIEDGITMSARVIQQSAIPRATSITFRVSESFHEIDYKEALEAELSAKGILTHGDVIEVAGYELVVTGLEPASLVFCDGEEVVIHFELPGGVWRGNAGAGAGAGAGTEAVASMFPPEEDEDEGKGKPAFKPFSGAGRTLGGF